jgi:phospholipid/cholesterol/gamma-HCH transport system substrate-binding protein
VPAGESIELEIRPGAGANARVTLVIVIAIGIAATLIFLITGGGTKLFSPQATLTTLVPSAAGTVSGSEVRLSGIPIGNVTKVDLSGLMDPQRVVRIDMRVDANFLKNIPSDSQTVITEDTLVGDQFVSIEEGKSPIPVSEDAILPSEPVKQAADQANLIRILQNELVQVDDLVTQMSTPTTQVGQAVLGSKQYDQLLMRLNAFNRAMHSFVGPESQIGPVLFSEKLYTDIRTYVANVDKTLASIQNGEGAAGRLFANDEQYDKLLRDLRDLRKSLADASAGSLLHDDAAYLRIRKNIAQTDELIAAFNTGRLLRDQQLYESLNGSLRDLEKLLADLRTNPQKYLRYKIRQ